MDGAFSVDIVWQSEDSLREKKVESDLKDLLKTLVAFANSVAPEDTARIFIGEKNDGTVHGVTNTDNIQKSVKKEADKIYPEIYFKTEVYEREGKQCVRVDIKYNGLAPHFGGAAWVRKGSETIVATEELYQQMVELRQDKVRVLSRWLKHEITVEGTQSQKPFMADPYSVSGAEWSVGVHQATLVDVNMHWVTFNVHASQNHRFDKSEPMEKLLLSWDDERKRLKVVVKNWSK
jgi:Putative DNA-binding domain